MSKTELNINGNVFKFEFDIRQVIVHGDLTFVLLSIPGQCQSIRNVYCYKCGEKKWQVEDLNRKFPLRKNLPFEIIQKADDSRLIGTDFYGRRYCIDMENGMITNQISSVK